MPGAVPHRRGRWRSLVSGGGGVAAGPRAPDLQAVLLKNPDDRHAERLLRRLNALARRGPERGWEEGKKKKKNNAAFDAARLSSSFFFWPSFFSNFLQARLAYVKLSADLAASSFF